MKTGTVKKFNETKGFGFIMENARGEELFVFSTELKNSIREGDKVAFDVTQGKYPNAMNVKKCP